MFLLTGVPSLSLDRLSRSCTPLLTVSIPVCWRTARGLALGWAHSRRWATWSASSSRLGWEASAVLSTTLMLYVPWAQDSLTQGTTRPFGCPSARSRSLFDMESFHFEPMISAGVLERSSRMLVLLLTSLHLLRLSAVFCFAMVSFDNFFTFFGSSLDGFAFGALVACVAVAVFLFSQRSRSLPMRSSEAAPEDSSELSPHQMSVPAFSASILQAGRLSSIWSGLQRVPAQA